MFLGEHASDVREIATIDPTDAVPIHRVGAISGDRIADVNDWDSSKNGENK